jgi:ubiquinone/menaquinone biosynthesis C-methylase UbiE
MSKWDTEDDRLLVQLLVGDHFGDRPEERLDEIRASKKARAAYLRRTLGWTSESVVLEIGSGMGFTSRHVAGAVKRLYCCDISDSFLNVARRECTGIDNIEFTRIDSDKRPVLPYRDEFFDMIFADAVFIHLNLYDIFWYFSEFQRVAKRGGKVLIDIMNASRIEPGKFSDMADYYSRNKQSLARLLCWNSPDAVVAIADRAGFRLASRKRWWRRWLANPTMLFEKR